MSSGVDFVDPKLDIVINTRIARAYLLHVLASSPMYFSCYTWLSFQVRWLV
jgi:hypothetical protein